MNKQVLNKIKCVGGGGKLGCVEMSARERACNESTISRLALPSQLQGERVSNRPHCPRENGGLIHR